MKRLNKRRSKRFIFDGERVEFCHAEAFNDIDFFDHDLILFCDGSSGYRIEADKLRIIGGRSAKSLKSESLISALDISESDSELISSFLLSDGDFALVFAGERVALIWNGLFHSTGLGVAVAFEYPPECALTAIREGMLDDSIELFVSNEIMVADGKVGEECLAFAKSVFRTIENLKGIVSIPELDKRIMVISDLVGCAIDSHSSTAFDLIGDVDAHTLAAALLCILSVCRRMSATRSVGLSIGEHNGRAKISIECKTLDLRLSAADESALYYCESLASRLEMPLSIDVDDGHIVSEFIPCRVDPSLHGLKAGVRIAFKD